MPCVARKIPSLFTHISPVRMIQRVWATQKSHPSHPRPESFPFNNFRQGMGWYGNPFRLT